MVETTHIIEGMTCGKCVGRLQAVLKEHNVVGEVGLDEANPGFGWVRVSSKVEQIEELVEEAGFEVVDSAPVETSDRAASVPVTQEVDLVNESRESSNRIEVPIEGMTCAACVSRVERALAQVQGVDTVVVNLATETAVLRGRASMDQISQALSDAGYGLREPVVEQKASERREDEAAQWRRRWIVGLVLLPPIATLQMGPDLLGLHLSGAAAGLVLGVLGYLTAVVLWVVGRPFFTGGWASLKHGSANMDVLVALGSGVAFAVSIVDSFRIVQGAHLHVHFETAAMIVTLIAVGKWLEARSKGQASEALEALLNLGADVARVRLPNGNFEERPATSLVKGDHVQVRAGEKIPADGVITDGAASIDESMLSGESLPVRRGAGDQVSGGTINLDGAVVVEIQRAGKDTILAQIAKVVSEAQSTRGDLQRLADKVSAIFVPVVLVIAFTTFIVWGAVTQDWSSGIMPAIAVLVVACPCALGLATPTAIMVGSSVAAQHGVLVRDALAFERSRRIDTVVFDKTGTLTKGQLQVLKSRGKDEESTQILSLAEAVERGSTHPVARAIRSAVKQPRVAEITSFQEIPGEGVSAIVDGQKLRVVRGTDAQSETWMAEGATVVELQEWSDEEWQTMGWIAVGDDVREDSEELIATLKSMGISSWLISGDHETSVRAVAERVGIPEAFTRARVRPLEKRDEVLRLQSEGRLVGMVGDGINDAPALSQANLGIAVMQGSDIAKQSADIVLLTHDLGQVVRSLQLVRRTYRKIQQNLFWAFIYNTALIPLAAFGVLHPMLAAAAMGLSSFSVVTNSLLLRRAWTH